MVVAVRVWGREPEIAAFGVRRLIAYALPPVDGHPKPRKSERLGEAES